MEIKDFKPGMKVINVLHKECILHDIYDKKMSITNEAGRHLSVDAEMFLRYCTPLDFNDIDQDD